MKDKSYNFNDKLSTEENPQNAINVLSLQNEVLDKRVEELLVANKELASLNAEQQSLFASIVNSSNDVMFSKTLDGIITTWNHGAEKIFGYMPTEIIGKHIFLLIPLHLQHEEVEIAKKIRNGETLEHYETKLVKKDGTVFNATMSISPLRDLKGNISGASNILRDISELKKAEAELIKANRLCAFTSAINQMIVKATDENSIFNQACSIAVDIGKYKMAWIGMIDEVTKKVIPLVHAGEVDDCFTEIMPISIDDIPGGRGSTGKSLSEGRYIICNDIENDPKMALWKETAAERGYLSSIAFPLRKSGKVIGTFNLYASKKNFFDDAEIALLEEVGDYISFTLEILENNRQRIEAEKQLKQSEEKQKIVLQTLLDYVVILNAEGEIHYINHFSPGLTEEEVIGSNFLLWLHEEDQLKAKKAIRNTLDSGAFSEIQVRSIGPERKMTWFNAKIILMPDVSNQQVLLVATDFSKQWKNEKALMEYKYALDQSSIVAITDQEGIIKYVNENFCKISKYSTEELIGQDHRIVNSGYHPKSYIRNLWETIANGKTWRGEMRNKAKDGTIYWVDATILPLFNEYDEPIQYIAIRADITERKKAEEEMKLLTKRLLLATTSAGMGIWDWDKVSDSLEWDEGMYRLYGMDEKQFISTYDEWTSRLHPQDTERINEDIQNAISGTKQYDSDFRIVLNDSTVRYIKASGLVERDAEGNALHMIGVNWDITEIKEHEQQIRKSEEFNRTVLNSLSSHLAVANDKGEIIATNKAWTRFFLLNGKTSMERTGIGSNYFDVCEKATIEADEIAAQVLQGMKDVLNQKVKDFYIEYPCHSPSKQRWFGLLIVKFESDEPLILLVHTNLTDRKLAEFERQKIIEDLIQRNQDLEQFTYIVSHNLRAPVANIKGLSRWVGDESLSKDDARRVAKGLLSSVSNLDTVIVDLNNILQLKKGVNKANERVVFAELVKGIEESIHSLVLRENVMIVAQFEEVSEIITLKNYLYSIFYNLIINSIKYKRQDVHPVIEIKTFRRKDKIELLFKDNGRGIDLKNNGDQVFGLYKRFHHDIEGKGMGLFMVKTQIEALGGKISIESEVNNGTTFKIILTKEKKHGN